MDRKPDFASDLSVMTASVDAEVGDVLRAISQQKRKLEVKVVDVAAAENVIANAVETPVLASPPPRTNQKSRRRPTLALDDEDEVVLENVTTRLRRETNALLTEAALRQRLKKTNPATRQDIVEVALREWFKKEGYSS